MGLMAIGHYWTAQVICIQVVCVLYTWPVLLLLICTWLLDRLFPLRWKCFFLKKICFFFFLGLGRGGQEPACKEVGSRLRELTDLKRRRLPKLPLPSLLSVSSAHCSVFSFSSSINLKYNKIRHLPLSAEEPIWTINLGWHSVSWLANSRNSCSMNISAKRFYVSSFEYSQT